MNLFIAILLVEMPCFNLTPLLNIFVFYLEFRPHAVKNSDIDKKTTNALTFISNFSQY